MKDFYIYVGIIWFIAARIGKENESLWLDIIEGVLWPLVSIYYLRNIYFRKPKP